MRRAPLWDMRLSDPSYRAELERMAREAGWAEVGGSIIRKSNDYYSPDYNVIVGRTHWVPFAEWYQRMQQSDANMPGGGAAVKKAIARALAKRPLTPQQRRTVRWMLNEHESFLREWEECDGGKYHPDEREADETEADLA